MICRSVVALALTGACLSCLPPLERTPPATARSDAGLASAQVPIWRPGDVWRYRGGTFDSKDNRFYQRVLRETVEGGRRVYEIDGPEVVEMVDVDSLRPLRRRSKDTGRTTGAMTFSPLFFPLHSSTRYTASGTRERDGERQPFLETCRVVNYEDVEVHAGKFAAFRIDCRLGDGFAEHWYAPAVKNLVKMRWAGDRESFSAELWDYELAAPAPPPELPVTTCPPDSPDTAPSSLLRATLRVRHPRVARIEDLAVDVTLSNEGAAPVRWLGTYVGTGTLSLEVRDASCQRLAGGPPPTPRADDGVTDWNVLAPGGSVPVAYHGWILVDAPAGKYEVRFTGIPGDTGNAQVRSAWMPFEVVGK